VNIQIFSDVVCPWCFIGTVRLDRVLADMGVEARVSYRPFMLDPDTPPEGFNVPESLRRKYGVDPRQLWERAEASARESGLALDLSKQAMSYPTARAHTLLRHAAGRGTQRALAHALFAAYFQEARNIHDPQVLAEVAAPHGFAADEVAALVLDEAELTASREAAEEAVAMGVRGAPFFVFDDKLALSGAQPEAIFRQAIEQARQR
jgi:predicted DsbA family dithiol-disulfide isomerase